jgi:hypothetical protein
MARLQNASLILVGKNEYLRKRGEVKPWIIKSTSVIYWQHILDPLPPGFGFIFQALGILSLTLIGTPPLIPCQEHFISIQLFAGGMSRFYHVESSKRLINPGVV